MSKKQITFFHAQVVDKIHAHLNGELTKDQIKQEIKENAGYYEQSLKDLDTQEMEWVISVGFMYGDELGLNLDYLPDELDEKINFNWDLE